MAEQHKDTGAITHTATGGTSTAIKHHKDHKGPSVKDHLSQTLDYVKKSAPRGTGLLLIVGAVAVVVVLLFRYFYLSSEATASGRWMRVDQATFLGEVETVANDADLKDTQQARVAKFAEARMKLDSGLKNLGVNREQALKEIESARQVYEELAKSSGRVPLLHQEAIWGAAKASESLGHVPAATELYSRLAQEYPTAALGKDAKKQLERLSSPATKKDLEEISTLFNLKGPN